MKYYNLEGYECSKEEFLEQKRIMDEINAHMKNVRESLGFKIPKGVIFLGTGGEDNHLYKKIRKDV